MSDNELKQLLAGGKDCGKIQEYRKAYKHFSGKEYPNNCTSCACAYLFKYLQAFLR